MEIRRAQVGELQTLMKDELENIYPAHEAEAIIKQLFFHLTGKSAAALVLEKERICSESEIFFLQHALSRLKKNEPMQYITGKAYFRDLELKVNASVLIPRPETEELVQWVIDEWERAPGGVKIIDIGTGSGCIAISLSREIGASKVTAVDISEEALKIAHENARTASADVLLKKLDILDKALSRQLPQYDIIISNPPYVTPGDKLLMHKNVSDHEPATALFVPEEDPLLFYREIILFAIDHLHSKGSIYFECNEGNASEVVSMLKSNGFADVILRKDMQGKERMVKAGRV